VGVRFQRHAESVGESVDELPERAGCPGDVFEWAEQRDTGDVVLLRHAGDRDVFASEWEPSHTPDCRAEWDVLVVEHEWLPGSGSDGLRAAGRVGHGAPESGGRTEPRNATSGDDGWPSNAMSPASPARATRQRTVVPCLHGRSSGADGPSWPRNRHAPFIGARAPGLDGSDDPLAAVEATPQRSTRTQAT